MTNIKKYGYLLCISLCLYPFLFGYVRAQTIGVTGIPALRVEDDALVVSAQFDISLPIVLEDALQRGVPLYFIREFELVRSQRYWLNEDVLTVFQSWRLDYYALTRQYRLSSGLFHQNVNSLPDALRLLQRAQSWKVAEKVKMPKGTFEARIRLRFDSSRLPTPLQLDMFNIKELNLLTGWYKWSVNL